MKKQTEKGKDPATLTEEKWKKSLDKLTLAPVAKRQMCIRDSAAGHTSKVISLIPKGV